MADFRSADTGASPVRGMRQGCGVVWSIMVDFESTDEGSNPSGPIWHKWCESVAQQTVTLQD